MADSDVPRDGAKRPVWRAFIEAWFLVEVGGLLCVCAGVSRIYPPAALILLGSALILAVERGSSG